MSVNVETVRHKKKESTFKWFIIAIIPILNLWFLWKLAELVAAHEKISQDETKVPSQAATESFMETARYRWVRLLLRMVPITG